MEEVKQKLVNIYCDESSYTNPLQQYFLIGALEVPREQKDDIVAKLKKARRNSGFNPELKWQNVTETKLPYLNELLQIFFSSELNFRTIIVDKSKLDKLKASGPSELQFYKFYYLLLRGFFRPETGYYLFLDQRTKSGDRRLGDLQRYLQSSLQKINTPDPAMAQNEGKWLRSLQEIDSHESLYIQLLDLLMGAVGYYWNGLRGSPAKLKFIENLCRQLQKPDLNFSSQLYDTKWNQFVWRPAEVTETTPENS